MSNPSYDFVRNVADGARPIPRDSNKNTFHVVFFLPQMRRAPLKFDITVSANLPNSQQCFLPSGDLYTFAGRICSGEFG